jgi:hypothetical protein
MNNTKQTAYGYILDGKVFLKGYNGLPDRELGVVKETEEEAIAYFEKRYATAQQKVADLQKMIDEAENKGSYLMKLIHLKAYLEDYKAIGDFPALFAELRNSEIYLKELVAQNRIKNLEIKRQLIQEAEELAESTLWQETSDKLQELKLRWIKTGPLDDLYHDELEGRFTAAIHSFFQKKKEFLRNKATEQKDRLNLYKEIVDKAYTLRMSNDFEETSVLFKQLQTDWKAVGKVPQVKMAKLWERFKKVNNDFFFRYKQFKAGVEAEQIKSFDPALESKQKQEALSKKAESLVGVNTDASLEEAKNLLVGWKNSQINPKYLDRDFAQRFRLACDRIFEEGYLMKIVRRKYPDYEDKPKLDQFRIKNSFLRELIRKDEQEIHLAENTDYVPANKNFNLGTQKRKVEVKKLILKSFEDGLKALYQTPHS